MGDPGAITDARMHGAGWGRGVGGPWLASVEGGGIIGWRSRVDEPREQVDVNALTKKVASLGLRQTRGRYIPCIEA